MKKIQKNTKSAAAYEKLKKMIISGQFSSHDWSLRKLASRFKMSTVPISEAVRRLEQEEILVAHPQRGISINQLTMSQVQELNIIREAMEIQAARLLAVNGNKQTFDKLLKMAEKIEKLNKENKRKQTPYLDFKLHKQIVEEADCQILTEKYNQLVTACMVSTGSYDMSNFGNIHELSEGHIELVKAIASGNQDKAEKAIREHIKSKASI